jgi:hypothetical protein
MLEAVIDNNRPQAASNGGGIILLHACAPDRIATRMMRDRAVPTGNLLAEREAYAALLQFIGNRARVGHRPGEAIQFRHHQSFVGTHGWQRLGEAGAIAVAASEAVVNLNAVFGLAEFDQRPALGGDILFVGRAAGISNESNVHP